MIPMIDLTRGYIDHEWQMMEAISEICRSQKFILSEWTERLERDLRPWVGESYAVACSSGTDALVMALTAAGIGPGDEVITSPFTFIATAGAIVRVGAKPVFVDIDPLTFCIDPAKIEKAITVHTAAIIPVHIFGQCCDMDKINAIAARNELVVIEDACQAIGATWRDTLAGNIGDFGAFSFFPSKNLGGFGDSGMVSTKHMVTADRLRIMRCHGGVGYEHAMHGGNYRIDEIQAAALCIKLPRLHVAIAKRRTNACRYLCALGGVSGIVTPYCHPLASHTFNQFTIRVLDGKRDALRRHLTCKGIGCAVYYPIPLHLQECYASLGYRAGDLPEAERAAAEVLSLPIYPELSYAEHAEICHEIRAFMSV